MERKFQILSGLLKAYESEDGEPRLKTTASSTVQDHGKDRMFPSAIEQMAASAQQNMTIFLNHSYSVPEDVLGSVENAEIRQAGSGPDGAIYDLDFDVRVNKTNPRAIKTWEAIKSGVKLGTSIGAIVKDWDKNAEGGWDIKAVELLEASIVGIPANPRSWVHYAVKALTESETVATTSGTVNLNITSPVTTTGNWDSSQWTLFKSEAEAEEADDADEDEDEEAIDKAMCPGCNKAEGDCTCPEGCECGRKDTTPELVKDQSSEAVDELTVESSAQEADDSAPEDAPEADDPEPEVNLASIDPEIFRQVVDSVEFFATKVTELEAELDDERETRRLAQEALDTANANLELAKQIIDTITDLPLPRKARIDAAVSAFHDRLSGVYGKDFLKMLENK